MFCVTSASVVSSGAVTFYMEPFFPLGDWRWLVIALVGYIIAALLVFTDPKRKRSLRGFDKFKVLEQATVESLDALVKTAESGHYGSLSQRVRSWMLFAQFKKELSQAWVPTPCIPIRKSSPCLAEWGHILNLLEMTISRGLKGYNDWEFVRKQSTKDREP